MSKGIVYKVISKKRIADLNARESPQNAVLEAIKTGEFNYARCEDFRFTSWDTEGIHIKHFIWRRGKFRGEFRDCVFSDGEITEVDFWDSDFKNVTFRNISFVESEINSSYSDKYIFQLDNVVFENCVFFRFWIGQAFRSNIYLNNCSMRESNFKLKSSLITFYKCQTEDEKIRGSVFLVMREPIDIEPIKIKECLFFCLDLVGDAFNTLNISSKKIKLVVNGKVNIKNLSIYCNHFCLDTTCETLEQLEEVKNRYEELLSPNRILENVQVVCSEGVAFGIVGFKIENLKIFMAEKRPKSASAIFYSHINNIELVGVKVDVLRFEKTTVNNSEIRSSHFNHFKLIECNILNLNLNSIKISKEMILNQTKIGCLNIEKVFIDKDADWKSDLSTIGVLNKPESQQENIKNISGQKLRSYVELTDVGVLK